MRASEEQVDGYVLHVGEARTGNSRLFSGKGIDARGISSNTKPAERNRILEQYESAKISELYACDLLNEGWDSPHIRMSTASLKSLRASQARWLILTAKDSGI